MCHKSTTSLADVTTVYLACKDMGYVHAFIGKASKHSCLCVHEPIRHRQGNTADSHALRHEFGPVACTIVVALRSIHTAYAPSYFHTARHTSMPAFSSQPIQCNMISSLFFSVTHKRHSMFKAYDNRAPKKQFVDGLVLVYTFQVAECVRWIQYCLGTLRGFTHI